MASKNRLSNVTELAIVNKQTITEIATIGKTVHKMCEEINYAANQPPVKTPVFYSVNQVFKRREIIPSLPDTRQMSSFKKLLRQIKNRIAQKQKDCQLRGEGKSAASARIKLVSCTWTKVLLFRRLYV